MKTLLLLLVLMPAVALADYCIPVSKKLAHSITGESDNKITFYLKNAMAVKSPDRDQLYFIGIRTSRGVAIFTSNNLGSGAAFISAVNALAKNTTVWPTLNKRMAGYSIASRSARKVMACLDEN